MCLPLEGFIRIVGGTGFVSISFGFVVEIGKNPPSPLSTGSFGACNRGAVSRAERLSSEKDGARESVQKVDGRRKNKRNVFYYRRQTSRGIDFARYRSRTRGAAFYDTRVTCPRHFVSPRRRISHKELTVPVRSGRKLPVVPKFTVVQRRVTSLKKTFYSLD